MKTLFTFVVVTLLTFNSISAQETTATTDETDVPTALNFTMKSIDGEDVELKDYQGKVVLIVNVASKCGLTPQYEGLQALHEEYADEGLAILGFPCNQFGKQEPGTLEEIKEFCSANYGVEFDMFSKIDVNGDTQCDLYKYLTSLDTEPAKKGKISWNFEKFLIGRDGEVIGRYSPRTKPNDDDFVEVVKEALKTE